jgi:hypothetical protein
VVSFILQLEILVAVSKAVAQCVKLKSARHFHSWCNLKLKLVFYHFSMTTPGVPTLLPSLEPVLVLICPFSWARLAVILNKRPII